MYGREPSLPLDQLLSRTRRSWDEDFVETQAAALSKMNDLVEKNLNANAEENKTKHDRRVQSSPLVIGQSVLLKRMAFSTRHKLKDKYFREPYVVVDINKEGDVYSIRPLHGGTLKTVNRKLLIADPRTQELCDLADSHPNHIRQSSDETGSLSSESETGEFNSDDDRDDWFQYHPPSFNTEENARPENYQNLRRSSRVTKGVHRNPYHLPRSTLSN
nr:uncharacterized protein LOC129258313 [Lytechinus pictus]